MLEENLKFELESYARNAKVFKIEKIETGVLLTVVKDFSVFIGVTDTRVCLAFDVQDERPVLKIYFAPEGQQASLLVQLPLFYSPQGWLTNSGQTNYIHTVGQIQTNTGCYKTLTQRLNEELNHHFDLASCGIILC